MKKWVFGFVVAVVVSTPAWVRAAEHDASACEALNQEELKKRTLADLTSAEQPVETNASSGE